MVSDDDDKAEDDTNVNMEEEDEKNKVEEEEAQKNEQQQLQHQQQQTPEADYEEEDDEEDELRLIRLGQIPIRQQIRKRKQEEAALEKMHRKSSKRRDKAHQKCGCSSTVIVPSVQINPRWYGELLVLRCFLDCKNGPGVFALIKKIVAV